MTTLTETYVLKQLEDLKLRIDRECEKAYDSFCLFPNEEDRSRWDLYSAYVVALEVAIECVEKEKTEE